MLAVVASPLAAPAACFIVKLRDMKEFWLKMPLFGANLIIFG